MWRRDVHVPTRTFLLPLFCTAISYSSHSNCVVVILKLITVPMFLHAVTNFVNQKAFSSKHVSTFFYCESMTSFLDYVTATLRALFAWRGSYIIPNDVHTWISGQFLCILVGLVPNAAMYQHLCTLTRINIWTCSEWNIY